MMMTGAQVGACRTSSLNGDLYVGIYGPEYNPEKNVLDTTKLSEKYMPLQLSIQRLVMSFFGTISVPPTFLKSY
jgi:hypothetical protein